jgi:hypothetical protein
MLILSASVRIHATSFDDIFSLWFTVLDPNVKNAYALDKWDTESYTAGMTQLEKVVRGCLRVSAIGLCYSMISCLLLLV